VSEDRINPGRPAEKGREDGGIRSATHGRRLDRQRELADFLRQRRARVSPAQVGLPDTTGRRRRTPGLRREELASVAGISLEWYVRMEQGRAERPSPAVLDALARPLGLSGDERSHLYALARGERPPLADAPREVVDPGLERILQTLSSDVPGYVLGRRWDVLSWNPGACELLVDFGAVPPGRRNLIELTFLDRRFRQRYADWEDVARTTLAHFRASVGRHLQLPEVQELVAHLSEADARFATLWGHHEVAEKSTGVKRFRRPDGGTVLMRYESVLSPTAQDQRLIVYTPASPGDDDPPAGQEAAPGG
jgi:transcriptional regulator with XRE-family HTH domain